MSENLLKDNDYNELKKLIENKQMVAFIGSGISTHACSWMDLIKSISKKCDIEEGINIEGSVDAQLFSELAEKAKVKNINLYHQALIDEFGGNYSRGSNYYPRLARLPFKSYITTNYDHQFAEETRFHNGQSSQFGMISCYLNCLSKDIGNRNIHYIHGLITKERRPDQLNVVLASSEFQEAYHKDSLLVRFLESLFLEHDVLFLGCGLREPEIKDRLEYCMKIFDYDPNQITRPKKFAFFPCCYDNNGRNIEEEEKENRYFLDLGVQILRYGNEKGNHEGLVDILEDLDPRPSINLNEYLSR